MDDESFGWKQGCELDEFLALVLHVPPKNTRQKEEDKDQE